MRPNLKKQNLFLAFCGDPFRGLWAPMWLPVAPLGRPAEGQGDLSELIGVGLNPRQISIDIGVSDGSQKKGSAAKGLTSGDMVKPHFGT